MILFSMSFDVLTQMIATHEWFATHRAYEFLFARVCTFMTAQFIASTEATFTVLPFANEFTRVHSLVGLQMTGLEVIFTTIWIVAFVDATAFRYCGCGEGFCGKSLY